MYDKEIEGVADPYRRQQYLDALFAAWFLRDDLYLEDLEACKVPFRELVFRGCEEAVQDCAIGQLRHLLTSDPSPSLCRYENEGIDASWCQAYRLQLLMAHAQCAQALCMADNKDALSPETLRSLATKVAADVDNRLRDPHHTVSPLSRRTTDIQYLLTSILGRDVHFDGVPVEACFAVVVDKAGNAEGEGRLYRYVLQRIVNGTGRAFVDPEQLFRPMDASFCDILDKVPIIICKQINEEQQLNVDNAGAVLEHHSYDLRVRIEEFAGNSDGKKRASPLKESSATGAAAWAMYFAFAHKIPDDGIIVIAKLEWGKENDDASLAGVNDAGIPAKTRAIVENRERRFDTIIFASESNKRIAEGVITGEFTREVKIDLSRKKADERAHPGIFVLRFGYHQHTEGFFPQPTRT